MQDETLKELGASLDTDLFDVYDELDKLEIKKQQLNQDIKKLRDKEVEIKKQIEEVYEEEKRLWGIRSRLKFLKNLKD